MQIHRSFHLVLKTFWAVCWCTAIFILESYCCLWRVMSLQITSISWVLNNWWNWPSWHDTYLITRFMYLSSNSFFWNKVIALSSVLLILIVMSSCCGDGDMKIIYANDRCFKYENKHPWQRYFVACRKGCIRKSCKAWRSSLLHGSESSLVQK